jgi:uncharacterized Tic20 family protein
MSETRLSQDERVVAAMAHGAAILPFWGLIATIVIWVTQKDKSPFVRFQALQAVVYQVLPILGFLLFFLCYFCSFGGVLLTMPLSAFLGENVGETAGVVAIVTSLLSVGLPFLVFGLAILLWLAYLAYAIYAAIRIFQGHDFRYAVVGRWLDRYLGQEGGAA